mmetsp:Transcript_10446/g.42263  ORF Transcript_10446/g.42263 Transcript_10446/m.42263 type:complete len:108 (+) Transcript_10446:1156-1479(+)
MRQKTPHDEVVVRVVLRDDVPLVVASSAESSEASHDDPSSWCEVLLRALVEAHELLASRAPVSSGKQPLPPISLSLLRAAGWRIGTLRFDAGPHRYRVVTSVEEDGA